MRTRPEGKRIEWRSIEGERPVPVTAAEAAGKSKSGHVKS